MAPATLAKIKSFDNYELRALESSNPYSTLRNKAIHFSKTSGSVSKKIDFVLTGTEDGSKQDKAKVFGVPVVDRALA